MVFKNLKIFIILLILTTFGTSSAFAETEKECFEKVSRGIFKFNQGFDNLILEPIAKGYNKLPEPLKNGTGNFTSNIATLLSIPNHLLQGELKLAGHATGSFLINSTVGVLGLGNPAGALGLKNQKEDLGQTLGTYGVGGGCYFVLPILGPTTLRDTVGMVVDNNYLDTFARVTWHEKEIKNLSGNKLDYIGVKAATAVDFRGDNMTNFESLEKNSIDIYAATKSLYLQNRGKKIKNSTDSNEDDWGDLDK
jgi:phospholipid-binding lipoprotein MlaA|tara:strand:+ start:5821 stop:6573 length:753 start_codon:yes stop_codon:yes gene_type:complete